MKAKRINVKDASPDMVVAEDVFTYSGQDIVTRGTVLTTALSPG